MKKTWRSGRKRDGRGGAAVALIWIALVVSFGVLLLMGKACCEHTEWFRWVWRLVWGVGFSILLVWSYRVISKRSH